MLRLLYAFFITGLFAVGGGLATIPFLKNMVDKYAWFSMEELMNMIAISESTPGPIGINMATFIGIRVEGYLGGVLTTLALVLPSVVIILLLIPVLERYRKSPLMAAIFFGLRPTSVALITAALLGFIQMALFEGGVLSLGNLNLFYTGLFLAFVVLVQLKKVHPALIIVLGAGLGMLLKL